MHSATPYWPCGLVLVAACSLLNDFSIGDGGRDAGADGAAGGSASDGGASDGSRPDTGYDAGPPRDGGACAPCDEPTPICDEAARMCVECLDHAGCDDGDVCTTDRCDVAGRCEHVLDSACVVGLTAGMGNTCAWFGSGFASCWGENTEGQLGIGTRGLGAGSAVPTGVMSLSEVVGMSSGLWHTCAVRRDGSVACWGDNERGQLGDGTTTDRSLPITVTGSLDADAIATGFRHTCARTREGRVSCWGINTTGQLGDGSTTDRSEAADVIDLEDAVEISAGAGFTCARRAAGTIVCWGQNDDGQLGDGTTTNSVRPIPTLDIADAEQLSAGVFHACAVYGGGQVACWGENADGQLGDGTTIAR